MMYQRLSTHYLAVFIILALSLVNGQTTFDNPAATTRPPLNALVAWERRINASLALLRTEHCKFFTSSGNCSELRARSRRDMNVHIASQGNQRGKISTVLPDKIKLVPTTYDAVVVIDPYPRHSLGHPVLVFFIDTSSSANNCARNERSIYTRDSTTGNGECITITQKSRRCTNRLLERKRKRRCDINFIPTVFVAREGKLERTPILQCVSRLAGFGNCARRLKQRPLSDKCRNSKRCSITPNPVLKFGSQSCDYALVLAGGWNAHTTTKSVETNVKSIWRYFRQNGFKHENIMVFLGNRYYMETDGFPHTRDSIPTENEFKIRGQIQNLCRSACVDSLVIYLNKPTKTNGAMLIWDENNDGYAEESERYEVRELIDDLRRCSAKQVTVIADQSFSGVLLEKFRSARRHSGRLAFKNILIISAASSDNYPAYGSFTKSFVKASNALQNKPRCLRDVIQDVAVTHPEVNYERGSQILLDRTIYGGPCDKNLDVARRTDMGCHFLSRVEWKKARNRG